MLKTSPLFVVVVLSVVALGQARKPATVTATTVAASNAFACDLYRALSPAGGNLFFSPYSISAALAMTRVGAAGETAKQMDAVLHTGGVDVATGHSALAGALAAPRIEVGYGKDAKKVPAYDLRIANALWGQQGYSFEDPFVSVLGQKFGAPLRRIDFSRSERARDLINRWVEDNTKAKIKEIVPKGLPARETRLVLANAIYFKASWQTAFFVNKTQTAPFSTSAEDQIRVRMMHQTGPENYGETEQAQILEFPSIMQHTSMLIVLPKQRGGLKAVESKLTAKSIADWRSRLKRTHVHVQLPRFKFISELDLNATLPKMGMRDAFDFRRANFSGMTKVEPLFLGVALHKAFVAVDEGGIEAAAATVVGPLPGSVPPTPVPFVVDHPFLFLILHKSTGCILFAGRVTAPTAVAKQK